MSANLMLHAGAQHVSLDDVIAATPPAPTNTWYPIGYGDLVQTTRGSLEASGLKVAGEEYAMFGDAEMFFGLLTLTGGADYAVTVGLRSSYNQRFAASIAAGSRVFVCDNLAFSGEIRVNRKQTRFAYSDLQRMVMEAMGRLGGLWKDQATRFEAYKRRPLTDSEVHDLLVRSMDAKVMACAYIAKVLEEWRNPRHPEFEERTVWSLFNSYTEAFKATNPLDLTDRTVRLQGLLDSVVDATENKNLVGDLVAGRALWTPAPAPGAALEEVLQATPATTFNA